MGNQTRKPVRACVAGSWRVVGILQGNVFRQRIREEDILRIRGAAGIDTAYDPPLRPDTTIRHELDSGAVYELTFGELLRHPKAEIAKIGPLHPERVYLAYRYWRCIRPPAGQPVQLRFFDQRQVAAG